MTKIIRSDDMYSSYVPFWSYSDYNSNDMKDLYKHIPSSIGTLDTNQVLTTALGTECATNDDYRLAYKIILNDLLYMGVQQGSSICMDIAPHMDLMLDTVINAVKKNDRVPREYVLTPYASIMYMNNLDVPEWITNDIQREVPAYVFRSIGYIYSLKIKGIEFKNGDHPSIVYRIINLYD